MDTTGAYLYQRSLLFTHNLYSTSRLCTHKLCIHSQAFYSLPKASSWHSHARRRLTTLRLGNSLDKCVDLSGTLQSRRSLLLALDLYQARRPFTHKLSISSQAFYSPSKSSSRSQAADSAPVGELPGSVRGHDRGVFLPGKPFIRA